ncbi:hypothetical protein [Saccharospirillum impatiens]|uniref:hypothetical protein n=1 Tax=Saccharospirillum impatiens TaxID=169438 RepID=UPI000412364E|nr:hypothetical protein [Saccharospirillum impatiens]
MQFIQATHSITRAAALALLSIIFITGCVEDGETGATGQAGAAGAAGYSLLLESSKVVSDSCWGLTEQRVYGHDTTGDGTIDDVVLEETLCSRERPDQQLYSRNVLYFQDSGNTDFLDTLQQLATQGVFSLFSTSNLAEFETLLENERIDVVFFMQQGNPIVEDTANLLADWVSNKRRLIYTTYEDIDSIVPTAMEAEFTGETNLGEANINSAYLGWQLDNPAQMSNPAGYLTYSRGLNAIEEGITVCTWGNDESCAVTGNDGRTLMVGFLFNSLTAQNQRQFALNALAYVLAYELDDVEQ